MNWIVSQVGLQRVVNANHDDDNNNLFHKFIIGFNEILVTNWPERNPSSHKS